MTAVKGAHKEAPISARNTGEASAALGAKQGPVMALETLLARGASGRCAVHNPLVEDHRIHGGQTLGTAVAGCIATTRSEKTKEVAREDNLISKMEIGGVDLFSFNGCDETKFMHPASNLHSILVSGPQGRVHGASLMAFFASSSSSESHCRIQGEGDTSKEGIPYALPHKWL